VLFAQTMAEGKTVLDAGKNPSSTEIDELVSEIATLLGMTLGKVKKSA